VFKGGFHPGFNLNLSYFKDHFGFLAMPFHFVPSIVDQINVSAAVRMREEPMQLRVVVIRDTFGQPVA
jgi:hypothetical protein